METKMKHTDYQLDTGKTLRVYTNCNQEYVDQNFIESGHIGYCIMSVPVEDILSSDLYYNFLDGDKYKDFIKPAFYIHPDGYDEYIEWLIPFVDKESKPISWKNFLFPQE